MFHPHPTSAYSFDVNLHDFPEGVLDGSRERPMLVDFWADWCAPCHALAPQLQAVVDELGGAVRLAKVEVDEGDNMKLAGHYRLRGFPTVLLFVEGQEVARFSGARATHWVRDWVAEHLQALVG